jgi:hypothetical protein
LRFRKPQACNSAGGQKSNGSGARVPVSASTKNPVDNRVANMGPGRLRIGSAMRFFAGLLLNPLLDIAYDIADALKIFGILIGHLYIKFIFDCHDDFHRVKGIGLQILHEMRIHGDDCSVRLQLFYDDFLDFFECHSFYLHIFAQIAASKLLFPNSL